MKIKNIILIAVVLTLAACSTKLPAPKKPDESKKVPINKTIPLEIIGELK